MIPSERGIKSKYFAVLLRVHAYTEDLKSSWVKKTLGLMEEDPFIIGQWADDDEGKAGCEFRNSPPLRDVEVQWYEPAFRTATEWLRTKSGKQFQRLREAGLSVDLCILGYAAGPIPPLLMRELARLELELYIISPP